MALSTKEVRALVQTKGWTFVDLAARWGISVTWMSRLVNQPSTRPIMYDDAFRGLPQREATTVIRETRHIRKRKTGARPWTPLEMFPLGRVFEATDSRVVDEGTRWVVCAAEGVKEAFSVTFRSAEDLHDVDREFSLGLEEAQMHFADCCYEIELPNVQR